MNILVCAKTVPEFGAKVEVTEDGRRYETDGPPLRLCRFDEASIETALRIGEAFGARRITAVAVGGAEQEIGLRRAMAMGVADAIRVEGLDGLQGEAQPIARAIADVARGEGTDLLLAGIMSEDQMRGAVGPMAAALLDWPWAAAVIGWEHAIDALRVQCEREAGRRDEYELGFPAVLCIQTGIHEVRWPSLSHTLRAKAAPIRVVSTTSANAERLDARLAPPASHGACAWIQGTLDSQVERTIEELHHRTGLV